MRKRPRKVPHSASSIGVARAFPGNPEVLLLDEPTSAVEPESEAIILESLIGRGRATFDRERPDPRVRQTLYVLRKACAPLH